MKAWVPLAPLLLLLLVPRVPGSLRPYLHRKSHHTKPVCTQPVYNWCSSWENSRICETAKECSALWRSSDARPVSVKLFYEALCPACRSFMVMMLFPTWLILGDDVMNVTLVPFGNAEEKNVNGTWEFTCQHGELECALNMVQTCVLYLLGKEFPNAFAVVNCMMSAADPKTSLEPCLKIYSPEVPVDDIMECAKGPQGNELMHQNAMMTDHLSPEHTYTPWILVEEGDVPYVCKKDFMTKRIFLQ